MCFQSLGSMLCDLTVTASVNVCAWYCILLRYMAIVAYTAEVAEEVNGAVDDNIYFLLNRALRQRKEDPAPFLSWKGYLFYLMRALAKLPKFEGVVYRGGNSGIDQKTVSRDYTRGRPIQWAAFSSTSTSLPTTKNFVNKHSGVIFKISVLTGRDICAYSFFPKESEILLSPNTQFTVVSEMYQDDEGYCFVDLAEVAGSLMMS